MINIRRAYTAPNPHDGTCYLVDRYWPRGISKEALGAAAWLKAAAPSADLCRWFGHDPVKWDEFQRRYSAELDQKPDAWLPLLEAARKGTITLLFGARDEQHNNAVALKDYLEKRQKGT
jgi:uncharacterized protein YeaO (DUF488 family)